MSDETTALVLARIQEIDRKDENQILAELAGELIEEYVYEFRDSRNRLQSGLSWVGTCELARLQGNIQIDSTPEISESDDDFRVVVRGTDLLRNVSILGGCHQPKKMRMKQDSEYIFVDDPYAFQKAISKAQRNVIKALTPTTVVKAIMTQLLNQQKGKPASKPKVMETKTTDDPAAITGYRIVKEELRGLKSLQDDKTTDEQIRKHFQRVYEITITLQDFEGELPPSQLTADMLSRLVDGLRAYKETLRVKRETDERAKQQTL